MQDPIYLDKPPRVILLLRQQGDDFAREEVLGEEPLRNKVDVCLVC